MTQTPYFTTLKNRGKIIISGDDSASFLQNLISNDIKILEMQSCIYSCLLTPQGKFLYDFFITKSGYELHIDCEGYERANSLAKLLNMYKLRANISIEAIEQIDVYTIIGSDKYGYKDPRHNDMGYRSYKKPDDLEEKYFSLWDILRISLCIPDGSRDMLVQKSTLLECNIDKLNGISFDKGCYIGQELTARMHYRGLAKKHLYSVSAADLELDKLPEFGENIMRDGKTIGEMRSSCGNVGIALLKDKFKNGE